MGKEKRWMWIGGGLLIGIFVFLLIIQADLLLKEQLTVDVTPRYASFTSRGEPWNVTLHADVSTKGACLATCEYRVENVNDQNPIVDGKYVVRRGKSFTIPLQLSTTRMGSGQVMYQFVMTCTNAQSRVCPSNESVTTYGLYTLSYELSPEQELAQRAVRGGYAYAALNVEQAQKTLDETAGTLDELRIINTDDFLLRLNQSQGRAESLQRELADIRQEWAKENYVHVDTLMLQKDLTNRSGKLALEAVTLREDVLRRIGVHNQSVLLAQQAVEQLSRVMMLAWFLPNGTAGGVQVLHRSIAAITNGTASEKTVTDLQDALVLLDSREEQLMEAMQADAIGVDIALLKEVRCLANGTTCSRKPARILSHLDAAEACKDITALHDIPDVNESAATRAARMQLILGILDRYADEDDGTFSARITELKTMVDNTTPANVSRGTMWPSFTPSLNAVSTHCSGMNSSIPQLTVGVENVTTVVVNVTPLPELRYNPPLCCVYGTCTACCDDPSCRQYPLLLVHGHSFVSKNSAFHSTQVFQPFEQQVLANKKYVNAGVLLVENSSVADLGRGPVPVLALMSYYIDQYRNLEAFVRQESKSSTIDTYAIRLKEQIDYVKQVTGSSQVDIIAHSMGGLVVRRYVQVFGNESLHTVILVGSPNGGIDAETLRYCKLFGEKAECDDMFEDSLFMKKLNSDVTFKPLLVVGRGCRMSSGDGDGIVTVENARIAGAPVFFVNGTCSSLEKLHSSMLDPVLYPQVYEKLMEALRQ